MIKRWEGMMEDCFFAEQRELFARMLERGVKVEQRASEQSEQV